MYAYNPAESQQYLALKYAGNKFCVPMWFLPADFKSGWCNFVHGVWAFSNLGGGEKSGFTVRTNWFLIVYISFVKHFPYVLLDTHVQTAIVNDSINSMSNVDIFGYKCSFEYIGWNVWFWKFVEISSDLFFCVCTSYFEL